MKSITIISSILLSSSLSFAIMAKPQPVSNVPVVVCGYDASEQTPTGTKDLKNGQPLKVSTVEDQSTEIKGFTLKAVLVRQCAKAAGKPGLSGSGSGACSDNYTLRSKIEFKGGIWSSGEMNVTKADKNKRLSTQLQVGSFRADAYCDVQ